MPPSRTLTGGLSPIVRHIVQQMSSSVSMPATSRSRAAELFSSSPASRGSCSQHRPSAARSLAPAVLYTTRPISRCMSVMLPRQRISSALSTPSALSSVTAASLRFIATSESSGRSTQERSVLAPMGDFVRSNTQSRLPRRSPVLRLRVSSRFRCVA